MKTTAAAAEEKLDLILTRDCLVPRCPYQHLHPDAAVSLDRTTWETCQSQRKCPFIRTGGDRGCLRARTSYLAGWGRSLRRTDPRSRDHQGRNRTIHDGGRLHKSTGEKEEEEQQRRRRVCSGRRLVVETNSLGRRPWIERESRFF
ncbi:hypothetical protein H106_00766 [Trichophyton rubrum CBS 735.88]|nr:hypothetical protein H106_00766 [Trichophyton rubrum CBS 735.88]